MALMLQFELYNLIKNQKEKKKKMNKLLLALLLTSASAHAGDYSMAVKEQQFCEHIGNVAKTAFGVKRAGISFEEFKTHVKPEWEKLKIDQAIAGYNADDAKSAYMNAWAACMDTM